MNFYKIWKEEERHTPKKDFQTLEQRVAKAGQRRSHVCWVEAGLGERAPLIHPPAKADLCGRQYCRGTSPRTSLRRAGPIPAGRDWPRDLGGLCSASDISGVKPSQRMQALASVSSRANDCTDFLFEVSRFTEEAAGSRKKILPEWDTRDLDCIPASAGDSLCS